MGQLRTANNRRNSAIRHIAARKQAAATETVAVTTKTKGKTKTATASGKAAS